MTPNRPYLLRALFDWICDNNCTPYLLVDATLEDVEVPFEHVNAGRIVLNASGTAVANFDITDDTVSFNTRFSGRDTWISVPMAAVLAIYAKETQEGMTFPPSDYPDRKQRAEFAGSSLELQSTSLEQRTEVLSDTHSEQDIKKSSEVAQTNGPKKAKPDHLKVIK